MIDLVKLFSLVQDEAAAKAKAEQSRVDHLLKDRLPGDAMLVFHPDQPAEKRFEFIDLPVAPRDYAAVTLVGLVEAVNDLHERKVSGDDPIRVMVSPAAVVAVIGEGKRREQIRLELQTTTAWDLLEDDGLRGKSQAEMVDTLRLEFANRIAPASFVPAIRKLKFNSNSQGHSDIAVGRESMGRAIMTEALADGQAIDESVTVTVRVWNNVSTEIVGTKAIACGTQVNLTQNTLSLRPVAGETETAMDNALSALAEYLRGKLPNDVVVFNGIAFE